MGVTLLCEKLSDVVPTKSGTHNHRRLCLTRNWLQLTSIVPGIWVPAFAGTTVRTSLQHDHVVAWAIGVEPLDQRCATLQPGSLVDVALVGQFVAIDRSRLDHQHRTCDAQATGAFGRSVVCFQSAAQASNDRGMPDDVLAGRLRIADDL